MIKHNFRVQLALVIILNITDKSNTTFLGTDHAAYGAEKAIVATGNYIGDFLCFNINDVMTGCIDWYKLKGESKRLRGGQAGRVSSCTTEVADGVDEAGLGRAHGHCHLGQFN